MSRPCLSCGIHKTWMVFSWQFMETWIKSPERLVKCCYTWNFVALKEFRGLKPTIYHDRLSSTAFLIVLPFSKLLNGIFLDSPLQFLWTIVDCKNALKKYIAERWNNTGFQINIVAQLPPDRQFWNTNLWAVSWLLTKEISADQKFIETANNIFTLPSVDGQLSNFVVGLTDDKRLIFDMKRNVSFSNSKGWDFFSFLFRPFDRISWLENFSGVYLSGFPIFESPGWGMRKFWGTIPSIHNRMFFCAIPNNKI